MWMDIPSNCFYIAISLSINYDVQRLETSQPLSKRRNRRFPCSAPFSSIRFWPQFKIAEYLDGPEQFCQRDPSPVFYQPDILDWFRMMIPVIYGSFTLSLRLFLSITRSRLTQVVSWRPPLYLGIVKVMRRWSPSRYFTMCMKHCKTSGMCWRNNVIHYGSSRTSRCTTVVFPVWQGFPPKHHLGRIGRQCGTVGMCL